MDTVPKGYYSFCHSIVGVLAIEDFGAGYTRELRTQMHQVGTSSRYFGHLLIQVIAVEIIIIMTQEDLSVQREEAVIVLEDQDAMEFGRLIDNEGVLGRTRKMGGKTVA
ncbi:uncharacterized protein H6S33_008073 [Morchella sextelata]|uniref:uncharacterized protein n=1 Tax=Morchella sextelata TaxID=1174677 RepID=UPI001D0529AC|nr:uncharacterized protein H6S33_008073 [Morchella sextelata]KAH0603069.1 hypothetical protein H6S33_008073 [Morchella sextelata]